MGKKCHLTLENGMVFSGYRFGAEGEALGEVVFTTGMTGYCETLTDPSYYGQIIVQTFPSIGNYGVIPEDFESDGIYAKAYIVRDWATHPSNFRAEGDLDGFLKQQNCIGMWGVDTRQLTRIVREHGVMNAMISDEPLLAEQQKQLSSYVIKDAVQTVGGKQRQDIPCANARYHIVLWDFGAKGNIAKKLLAKGCRVTVMPADATAKAIMAEKPDGVMLSNGPGNPAENTGVIKEISSLAQNRVPMFGICLGHQMMALALGGKTVKMKYGHRGANQPVRNTRTGRVYITSQNHGYAVDENSLPENAILRFVNINDGTCEGIDYADIPAFSVQFHPEACGGPLDTSSLFDRFISIVKEGRAHAAE